MQNKSPALIAIAAVVLVSGLVLLNTIPASGSSGARSALTPKSACPGLHLKTPICHVFLVFMENVGFNWTMSHGAYERYLAHKYALAAEFYSIEHYSFPAYVAATSGTVTNYVAEFAQKNVVDLIRNSNVSLTWKAYMQGMPRPCDRIASSDYRPAHNPFVFYQDIHANLTYCRAHDVGFGPWTTAVSAGTVPNYALFAPNVTNSCYTSRLVGCDTWLKGWLSPLVNASFFKSSVFFVTYDESVGTDLSGANGTTGGGHVYTAVVSPFACPGFTSYYNYTHYNLLTTTEWLLNLGRTGANDSWTTHPPMKPVFCFPPGWAPAGAPAPPSHGPAVQTGLYPRRAGFAAASTA